MEPIRVLLADDHVMFRKGLAALMAQHPDIIKVVSEAGDGFEALEKAREARPDIVLMDLSMPRCNGVAGTRLIREAMPELRVVMLTVSDEDDDLFEAIKAGAQGYLLKNLTPEHLFEALQGAMRGEAALSPTVATRLLQEFRCLAERTEPMAAPPLALTTREGEILQLVAEGHSNKEIGAQLYIAPGTVKNHLRNILEKLQLQNRTQAAAYATRAGLVKLPANRSS